MSGHDWSDPKVRAASERLAERLLAAGVLVEDEGKLTIYDKGQVRSAGIVPGDDDRADRTFAGIGLAPEAVREWLDQAVQAHLQMFAVLVEAKGGVDPAEAAALLGGLTYQSFLFGWEIAQDA